MHMTSKRHIRVSAQDRKKQKEERTVFRKFIRSDGVMLSVVARSIRSRLPPQPDIYCMSTCHVPYRFELCELADRGMKDAQGNYQFTLNECLSSGQLPAFNAKYDACDIDVSRPLQDIRRSLRTVAAYLLSDVPTQNVPRLGSESLSIPLQKILGRPKEPGLVQIYWRGLTFAGEGARWHVESSGSFGDGVAKAINSKSSKTYEIGRVPSRPQLLLYYSDDPPYMESFACQDELSRLRPVWEPRFTDVWVFDVKTSKIIVHEVA